jgi:uncharacterized membrane protein YqgA involved in biofilm formation
VLGTLVNTGAVIAGSGVGAAFGSRLPARLHETLGHVIGLVTLLIGMKMAFGTKNEALVLGALLLGALVGEALDLEGRLEAFGRMLERRLGAGRGEGFAVAFITPTLLYCVGPMTLVGCIRDGMNGDASLLMTKSVLDVCSSAAFAAALGWKVMSSAVSVLVIQGGLTLGASQLSRALTPRMSEEMFATGGVILLGLGLRLLELKAVRVANLLPALVFAPLLVRVIEGR